MSLEIAVSGLIAFQRALATTAQNIANVNTEGYSRQRVELSSRAPELAGNSYLGTGVTVSATERIFDQFLNDRVISRTATQSQLQAYYDISTQIDAAFGDSEAGLSPVLNDFFNSVQDVANNPTSTAARQVLLSNADTLNDRFQALDRQVQDMRGGVNTQIEGTVTQLNSLAQAIADLNQDIVSVAQAPADLLDQRDQLVQKLAELTTVNTIEQSDGSMNVYIGSGQALVLGTTVSTLGVANNEFDVSEREIVIVSNGSNIPITSQMTGGRLGGLLDVRREVIDLAQMSLGQVAMSLADQFNAQHQLGDDLNGNPGGLFFTDIDVSSPTTLPSSNNNAASGSINVTVTDTNALKPSDYRLNYDGTNFTLTRVSDGVLVDSGFTVADFPRSIASEGLQIAPSGSVAAGDSFLIRPTRYAAGQTGLQISDPAQFAAAASGAALGNNSNALLLAGLQTQRNMDNSTATYQEAYGKLIAGVAVKTNQAGFAGDAEKVLLNQAINARASVSGVNLDEEAANLIKFQQAYQASAQVIAAVDTMFQVLLGAVSR